MRKFYAGLLAATFLIGLQTSVVFAKDFPDVKKSHWANKEIQALEKDQIVVGYPDGYFKPDQSASRAEFATMTVKALRQENCNPDNYYYYKDVPRDHWAFDMIEKAHYFELITGYPTEYFRPLENITRLDAVKMMIASVETSNISNQAALSAVKSFKDADSIPVADRVDIGKAKILKMIANSPEKINVFEPARQISRAEISYSLYNMRKQALARPNRKLLEAMKPKYADGYVIDPVTVDGTIVTIPAGTMIPGVLVNAISSQQNKVNDIFVIKTKINLVTKEKFFLIPSKSCINGFVADIKPARYFWRNGKVVLETDKIAIYEKPKAKFAGNVDIPKVQRNWIQKAVNFVVRGTKVNLYEGQEVCIKLNKPVKIDITNQTVINN